MTDLTLNTIHDLCTASEALGYKFQRKAKESSLWALASAAKSLSFDQIKKERLEQQVADENNDGIFDIDLTTRRNSDRETVRMPEKELGEFMTVDELRDLALAWDELATELASKAGYRVKFDQEGTLSKIIEFFGPSNSSKRRAARGAARATANAEMLGYKIREDISKKAEDREEQFAKMRLLSSESTVESEFPGFFKEELQAFVVNKSVGDFEALPDNERFQSDMKQLIGWEIENMIMSATRAGELKLIDTIVPELVKAAIAE